MPIEIEVLTTEELTNFGKGYVIVRNEYCDSKDNIFNYTFELREKIEEREEELIECNNLEELAEQLSKYADIGEKKFHTPQGFYDTYDYDDEECDNEGTITQIKIYGLTNEEKNQLMQICNKNYNELMSRQLTFKFRKEAKNGNRKSNKSLSKGRTSKGNLGKYTT